MPTKSPLDEAARTSLLGAHARFAESVGRVLRYDPDVSVFACLPLDPDAQDWRDAATLIGPGGTLTTSTRPDGEPSLPPGWVQVMRLPGVQLVGEGVVGAPDGEIVRLGVQDVPEILDLVQHAKPGPFRSRTIEMGAFLGIRHEGRLIAMAGERLRPPGWTELSAICTHSDFRGQGLATRLVRALVHGIHERGEMPFLHASAENHTAIRLYEELGFRLRRETVFCRYQYPLP